MAKSNKEIIVRVGANTAEFNKAMKGINSGMGNMQKQMASMGGAMAGLFSVGAMTSFGVQAVKSADEQARANAKLLAALGGREDVQKRLLEQAEDIRSRTGIDDAVINSVQTFAAAQGRSETQIKKNTEAAVQLSAVTGVDLFQAMKTIDATMEGNVGKLGKLDSGFKDLTVSQLKNGEAVDLILKKYTGLAESQATDLQILTSNWGEFQEQVGTALSKVLNPLLIETNKLLKGLTSPDLTWMDKLEVFAGSTGVADLQAKARAIADIKKQMSVDNQKAAMFVDNMKIAFKYNPKVKEKGKPGDAPTDTPPTDNKGGETPLSLYIKQATEAYEKSKQLAEFDVPVPLFETINTNLPLMEANMYNITQGMLSYRDSMESAAASAAILTTSLKQMEQAQMAGNVAADMFMQVVDQEITSAQELGITIWNTSRKIIAAYLAEAIAGSVKSALSTVPFPLNLIVAGFAGAGAGVLFNTLVPKLADGGIVPSGYPNDTYPALLTSGEAVVPAHKLPELGGQDIRVYGVLKAGDIHISNERGSYLKNRKG